MALLTAPPAPAPSKLGPQFVDKELAAIPFGITVEATMKHISAVVAKTYEKRYRATVTDPHARDRLQEKIKIQVQAIRDSYIEFKGQKTGYTVSVVGEEFAHSAGESMLIMPNETFKHYFFFSSRGGGLWKIVKSKVSRQTFAEFLVGLVQVYGAADQVVYADPERKARPKRASWNDGKFLVKAKFRQDFSAITVSWTLRKVHNQLSKLRRGEKPAGKKGDASLDPAVLDIMRD